MYRPIGRLVNLGQPGCPPPYPAACALARSSSAIADPGSDSDAASSVSSSCATLVALTIGRFSRIDRPAGGMLVPYLAWVTFATALNAAIVLRN